MQPGPEDERVSHGFVHDIDPIIATVGGVHLWWYGAFYAAGFLFLHAWLLLGRRRTRLGVGEVYTLSILFAGGVLAGGRLVEVLFYEWDYYGAHPGQIPALWLGGMSTHGLLLGAAAAGGAFCLLSGRNFLELADELAIPGAFVMGMGRMANFIDGQIVGSVTGAWWAVKFPDAEGFRHPVVLYDGIKNLLLIPVLLFIRSRRPARGVVFAAFILGYGLLRFAIDFLREYPARFLGLPPGQWFNLCMAALGLALIARGARASGHEGRRLALPATPATPMRPASCGPSAPATRCCSPPASSSPATGRRTCRRATASATPASSTRLYPPIPTVNARQDRRVSCPDLGSDFVRQGRTCPRGGGWAAASEAMARRRARRPPAPGLPVPSAIALPKAAQKGSTRGCSSGRARPPSTSVIPSASGSVSPIFAAAIPFAARRARTSAVRCGRQVSTSVPSLIAVNGSIAKRRQTFSTSSGTMIRSRSMRMPTREARATS